MMIDITVKLFATFRRGREKIIKMKVDQRNTIEDVLNRIGIKPNEVAILLVNGRDGHIKQILKNQDILSLFPPVGGG